MTSEDRASLDTLAPLLDRQAMGVTVRAKAAAMSALNEVAEYLHGRADVRDGAYGEPMPNAEMSLLAEVERALALLDAA